MSKILTIGMLKNDLEDSWFLNLYKALVLDKTTFSLSNNELSVIFKIALMLINYGDRVAGKFGYRLFVSARSS